jgi:hypothetical protein
MAEPGKKYVRLDREALAALRPFAEQAGVEIPGLIQHQPTIDLDDQISGLAQQLGSLCSRQPIFYRAEFLVALDDKGTMKPMSPERFGSWIEKFVTTTRWTRERGEHAATMSVDQAKKVLATDCFQAQIRELDFFFPVRLPIEREDGSVELLEPGYDEQTRSWTEDGVPYDTERTWDSARDVIYRYLGEWPYADRTLIENWALNKSRDASVILTGMLGVFCRPMFGLGVKRPMVPVSGNQAGTGKTTLCKMMMTPVYGLPPEMSLPPTEEKLERLLESTALGMEPFLFLDDVGKQMRSNALNKFVTASVHGGTRLYTQQTFAVPNVTQVFVTGNDLPIEVNLRRRVIWCELFLAGEVQDREFELEITDQMLGREHTRGELLSAMWAIVKEWGMLKGVKKDLGAGRRVIKSFEQYCRTLGGMIEVMGWADGFQEAPGVSGGDSEGREFQALLVAAADTCTATPWEFTLNQLVDQGRKMGILEYFVGTEGDGNLDKKERIRFGKKLGEFRQRVFQRTDGRYFEFGKRDAKGGSVYPCRFGLTREELQ